MAALRADLADIAKSDPALARSALAAVAFEMARLLDAPTSCNHVGGIAGVSPTSKSMCAGQLRDALAQLRELVPKSSEKDELDDLSARREARLARRATPAG